jgi:hypothetical protein
LQHPRDQVRDDDDRIRGDDVWLGNSDGTVQRFGGVLIASCQASSASSRANVAGGS